MIYYSCLQRCFWCYKDLKKHQATRDHVIPKSIGGSKTVIACMDCNHERGTVTELYHYRLRLMEDIRKYPDRISDYKNNFRRRIQKMKDAIIKWDNLHREKSIFLPFSLFEIATLDETNPL